MGIRDEMFRAKVLIFMIPLVLPIGQPPVYAADRDTLSVIECSTPAEDAAALSQELDLIVPNPE